MTDAIPALSYTPNYYTCISFVICLDFQDPTHALVNNQGIDGYF